MGLWEILARAIEEVTGKPPKEGSLYKYFSRKDSITQADGATLGDHFVVGMAEQPNGWVVASNGKIYPIVRPVGTTTPTVAGQVEIWDSIMGYRAPLSLLKRDAADQNILAWTAAGGSPNTGTAGIPWSPLYKSQALTAGAAVDTALIAAVAGKKFDVQIFSIEVVPVNAGTPVQITLTYQDEDNIAVAGHLTDTVGPYVFDTTTPRYAGRTEKQIPFGGARFITTVANKQLEVDLAGGAGAEVVILKGMYRQV